MTHSFKDYTYRHGCHHGHPHKKPLDPKYKSVHVSETIKVAEIRDAFNNLRFKVALTSFDLPHDETIAYAYQITVTNCFYAPDPLIIVTRPDDTESPFYNYDEALKLYHQYVQNYTQLVKAETRDFQDISIYDEKIGYKQTLPKCCITCKWCRKHHTPHDHVVGVTGRLECHNPLNIQEYDFDIDQRIKSHHSKDCHIHHGHPPYFEKPIDHKLAVYPNVKPFGICDRWETRKQQYIPTPGDSITRIIDRRVNYAVDKAISNELTSISCSISNIVEPAVHTAISNSISTDILPAVGEAIEYQLEKNPPIIIGDPEASLNSLMTDVNSDGVIDENDLEKYIMFDGGGA